MIKKAKRLKFIFELFIKIIPSLMNVVSLLALFMYIFAILGMNLFPFVKPIGGLNEVYNF